MSNYKVPEVEVSPEKIEETEDILNYVRSEQAKSEALKKQFNKKATEKHVKTSKFSQFYLSGAYKVQFVLLWLLSILPTFKVDQWIFLGLMLLFIVSEIVVLEQSRRMKPELYRYRKGCFFAVLDLVSVALFLWVFVRAIMGVFSPEHLFQVHPLFLSGIFLYTLFRKIYIYKNLTYEK